jgi:DNA-directed RNA polymerase subunit RPC12/RpoP
MEIKCMKCGHREPINRAFFAKIVGRGALAVGILALATGFAVPVCIAILAGGLGLEMFSDTILLWVSKNYSCPECGSRKWEKV